MADYQEYPYTDRQQRAFYGAGQAAQRAGQRFHMEREALERGDKAAAKYHRSRANALNRQGAYAAVRGMEGDVYGANPYFGVDSRGRAIRDSSGNVILTSAGRDIFDQFRDTGFVEPIRQKKRYAPNTEPKGLGWLMDQGMKNTMFGKMASSILPKKAPKPDDAYYSSLWGKGLNELYGPSGIFRSGKFLGKPDLDPYYTGESKAPLDALSYKYGIADLIPDDIKNKEINAINEIVDSGEGIFGRGDLPPDFDYEADREGRERSEKIVFLQSINPNINYNNVMPELIDVLYKEALEKAAQEKEFMSGNIGALNPLQPD